MVGNSLYEGKNGTSGLGPSDLKVQLPSPEEMISPVVKGGSGCRE